MAKRKSHKHHRGFELAVWGAGILLVIWLLPTLISDLESAIGVLTGGFAQVAVGSTSPTKTASATTSTSATSATSSSQPYTASPKVTFSTQPMPQSTQTIASTLTAARTNQPGLIQPVGPAQNFYSGSALQAA